jgi:hypothetical protein
MILKELLDDHQFGMSKFQDNYFVTQRAGGTLYGQYKQSLRELFTRFTILREDFFNYEIEKIEIEKLQNSLNSGEIENKYEKKIVDLNIRKRIIGLYEKERYLEETKREFFNFYRQAVHLKGLIGDLSQEKRDKLDRDMFIWRTKATAAIDYLMRGRISNETFNMIMSYPKDIKDKLLTELRPENSEKLSEWYLNHDEYYIPDDLSHIPIPEDIKEQIMEIEYSPEKLISEG